MSTQTLYNDFLLTLRQFKNEKRLETLLDKIDIFADKMNTATATVLIDCLSKNFKLFDSGRSAFEKTEFNSALRLLLHLIEKKIEASSVQAILESVLTDTPSFDLAAFVIDAIRRKSGNVYNIYENSNLEKLFGLLSKKAYVYFIAGEKNIFQETLNPYYILTQWGAFDPEQNKKVNDYVFKLIESDPGIIGKIINVYFTRWSDSRIEFRQDDLRRLFNEGKLYELAKTHFRESYANEEEKIAVSEFLRIYESATKGAVDELKRESNKHDFSTKYNNGLQAFDQRNYQVALEHLNAALNVTDWNDEYHWADHARLKKWQSLLELANSQAGELQEKYFEQASELASVELQINDMVNTAFSGGYPDRAPIELYYCLFYYLKWNNSKNEKERAEIKGNFQAHYKIILSNVSGRSEEITNRCNEMWAKMNPSNSPHEGP